MELIPVRNTSLTPIVRDMDRLWQNFFNSSWNMVPMEPTNGGWLPVMDVEELDNEIKVTTELPGVDSKNVQVTVSGDLITIKGEKKEETEQKKKNYYRSERCYGSFQRTVRAPADIDANKCSAEFKNGVMTVTCPKAEKSKTKQVEVKVK
ncbi:MAG: Hsp20/alpha crystallin family protein [Planctomycetes bacterium]|nr:Hsp20/alpha crystallin family protein [Planctomycetota bacterium]